MVSVVVLAPYMPNKLKQDLACQTYKDFEVILASEEGIVSAMNIALKKAKGDIFVRIDSDVDLPSTWLEELVKPFENPKVAGATGPTFIPYQMRQNRDSIRIAENPNWLLGWLFDNDPFAPAKIYKCGSVSYGSNFLGKMNRSGPYNIDHLEGTNWAMRTNLIRQVGGFDQSFDGVCEWFDTDVEFKIKKLGYIFEYNVNAFLWHLPGRSANYYKRFEGWGRIKNWMRFHWRHSKFHPKMVIWFFLMIGYFIWKKSQLSYRR